MQDGNLGGSCYGSVERRNNPRQGVARLKHYAPSLWLEQE